MDHRRLKTPLHISCYNKNKLLNHTFIDKLTCCSFIIYLSCYLSNLWFPIICVGFPGIYPHKLCNPAGADCSITPSPHKHMRFLSPSLRLSVFTPLTFSYLHGGCCWFCRPEMVPDAHHTCFAQPAKVHKVFLCFIFTEKKQITEINSKNLWKAGVYWSCSRTGSLLVLIKIRFHHTWNSLDLLWLLSLVIIFFYLFRNVLFSLLYGQIPAV